MDARQFHEKFGIAKVRMVCDLSGTTYGNWKSIKGGYRNPSVDLAVKMAKASAVVASDPMTVIDLLGLQDLPDRIVGRSNK